MAEMSRRESDEQIAKIAGAVIRIETLLIGESGSGLMHRVACVEKEIKELPKKLKEDARSIRDEWKSWLALGLSSGGMFVIGIIVNMFTRGQK